MRSSAALLLLCAVAAFSETYGWVRSGDRYENPVLLALLLQSDLDAADAVVVALAERTDGYVEDIIAGLLDQHSPRAQVLLAAYLSRVTLAAASAGTPDGRGGPAEGPVAATDEQPAVARSRQWAHTNPAAVARLLQALPSLRDAHTRAAVLRLLPHSAAPESRAVLASRLRTLSELLRASGGDVAGGELRELFAALHAAEVTGGHELAPALIEISRLSRDREVVGEARRVAERLLRHDLPE